MIMHLQHEASRQLRRLSRRYAFLLRRVSVTTIILTLAWINTIHWGERRVFLEHIQECDWKRWEEWPREATPHHLVFIADPQLVDPHTYPGRPWPLSTLTERYTDLYMMRNFRLSNAELDPDSIVFLGDLFDGGREWAPTKARPLNAHQIKILEDLGVFPKEDENKEKRSIDAYEAAVELPHTHLTKKEEHNIGPRGQNLKAFVPGENGRWSKWGGKQWDEDFVRFGKIFLAPEQLYPRAERQMLAAYEVLTDEVSIRNGANNVTWEEYATTGKSRRVLTSLPGNHDLGFGSGVQLVVRDRFHSHFGDSNRIDILGNHTFVSIDTPSLSAHSQFLRTGGETNPEQLEDLAHLWKPSMDFLEDLHTPAGKHVSEYLLKYFPEAYSNRGFLHEVTSPTAADREAPISDSSKEAHRRKAQLPVILLSHVPLHRPAGGHCGSQRERGSAIPYSMGYQYQNVLTQSLSTEIITKVSAAGEIVHAFSGDDHDYCDITHRYNIGGWKVSSHGDHDPGESGVVRTKLSNIREITVKSFSWAMGVRKPGFLLASLWNPVDADGETIGTPLPTVQTHLCLLPDQLSIFIHYANLLGLTLFVLLSRALILVLRGRDAELDEISDNSVKMVLPLVQNNYISKANGTAKGSSARGQTNLNGRHRASSTSLSSGHNNSAHLSVQRSHNARTRSISPALGDSYRWSAFQPAPGSLIEKAGYFPQVSWKDPSEDSDEESCVGEPVESGYLVDEDDSQAKWKRRRRAPGRARRTLNLFGWSVLTVAAPAGVWYLWLVKHG